VKTHSEVSCKTSLSSSRTVWKDFFGEFAEQFAQILVCGTASDEVRQLVSHLDIPPIPTDVQTSLLTDLGSSKEFSLHEAEHWRQIWREKGEKMVRSMLIPKSEAFVRMTDHSDFFKELQVNTTFRDLTFELVYFPYYFGEYFFEKVSYKVIVDGQTASHFVERPGYGLGKAGDLVKGTKNFVSTVLNWREDVGLCMGRKLAEMDNCVSLYSPENCFIIFPRSDSYLFTQSVGTLTLYNSGRLPVEILGQKRKGAQRGVPLTLESGQEITIDFKGWWCIEVIGGRWEDLMIRKCTTNGGNFANNEAGML